MTVIPAPQTKRTLRSIQILRAIAAIFVVIGHSIEEYGARFKFDIQPLMRLSWLSGVDIFFVISGFIMLATNWDKFGSSNEAKKFALHRIGRIAPLYWLFTLLTLAVAVGAKDSLGATHPDLNQTVTSFLFIPWPRPGDHDLKPVLSVGWTLNYEIAFYAIFSLCLSFSRRIGLSVLGVTFIVAAASHFILPSTWVQVMFWTDPIIFEFAFGCLIGIAWNSSSSGDGARLLFVPIWSTTVGVAILAVALAAFLFKGYAFRALGLHGVPGFLGNGLPAAGVVYLALMIPAASQQKLPSYLSELGDSSYSIYLSHRFGLRLATFACQLLQKFTGTLSVLAFVCTVTLIAISVGWAIFRFGERRLNKKTRQLIDNLFDQSTSLVIFPRISGRG